MKQQSYTVSVNLELISWVYQNPTIFSRPSSNSYKWSWTGGETVGDVTQYKQFTFNKNYKNLITHSFI